MRLAGRALLATQSDERLADLVRRGSEPAFGAIVERYRGALSGYCGRLVPPSDVDDIVQDAFLSAYRRLRSDGRDLALKPWLFRVAHNAAVDRLRTMARGFEQLSESYDGVERPEQALERKERLFVLVAGLVDLPQRQRAALVLRELEGRSYEEIEITLGLSGGALRQLLYRARANLRMAASSITPAALFLRPELPIGVATGAGAAKAGAVLATTAVVGAVALSAGPEGPAAGAVEPNGGGGSAALGAPSASETTEGRDQWATASERISGRTDAGGRRAPRRSADSAPRSDGAGPRVRRDGESPGLGAGEGPIADDDSAGDDDSGDDDSGDDSRDDDDSSGGDDSSGDDDTPQSGGAPGDDDDDSTGAPDGGGDDDYASSVPAIPAVPGNPGGEEADDDE